MFVISQYLLNTSGICKNTQQISTYSIALGLILYSAVYLYILFYNEEYLNIFNKFIIYLVVIDLLLSAFYYFNIQKQDTLMLDNETENEESCDDETENETEDEYIQESEDELSIEDELESQLYINNLIAQARVSDQERMSKLMESQETKQEPEVESEAVHNIDEEIEDIIQNVTLPVIKKKGVRKAKKIAE